MSSENKFTPGPWMLAEDGSAFVYALNDRGVNQFWLLLQSQPQGADADEIYANANLIAAAPELLEALEKLMDRAAVLAVLEDDQRERYLSAIAKAKGEDND